MKEKETTKTHIHMGIRVKDNDKQKIETVAKQKRMTNAMLIRTIVMNQIEKEINEINKEEKGR